MNKNFRSSKNLKQINHQTIQQKDDTLLLKLKIKSLQQQIQLLKKTHLNIYIPISQKQVNQQKQNKDQTIKKLRLLLLKQQQQNQTLKNNIKRLQKQKQIQKINYQNQLIDLKNQLKQKSQIINQLQQENQELQNQVQQQKDKRQAIQKQLIQIKVQLRFLKQDLQMYKAKFQEASKSLSQLKSLILQVQFNSKIYKANKIKITAIQTDQLTNMRNCIFQLQKEIQELLWKLANPKKQEKINLNINTKNVAQQIVRLKKNIDLQLGLKGDQNIIQSFLDKYSETSNKFKQLINGCKAPMKIVNILQKQ